MQHATTVTSDAKPPQMRPRLTLNKVVIRKLSATEAGELNDRDEAPQQYSYNCSPTCDSSYSCCA
jgi:hypothetical protein